MIHILDWTGKIAGAVLVSGLVYRTYLLYSLKRRGEDEEINEALFFPEDTSKTFKSDQQFVSKFLQVNC